MIKSANKAALETAQRKYMEKKAVFTPGAHMLVAHNQYLENRAPKPAPAPAAPAPAAPAPAAPAPVTHIPAALKQHMRDALGVYRLPAPPTPPTPPTPTTPEYIKSLEMLQKHMEDPSWRYPTSPTPGWDIWGDVNYDRDSLGNIGMDVGDYGLTSGWIGPDARLYKRTTTPILSKPDASENIQPATGPAPAPVSEGNRDIEPATPLAPAVPAPAPASSGPYTLSYDDIKSVIGTAPAPASSGPYTLGYDDIRSVVGPAPAPATEVKSEPAPAAPVTPVPAPRSDASATAQQGNAMMRGGRPNRASMYGVDPVPVPVFDPSKITRNDMRKYRRYTAANDMNSEMDKWKTWMAMQGHRNASNADYRRAKANGFRM